MPAHGFQSRLFNRPLARPPAIRYSPAVTSAIDLAPLLASPELPEIVDALSRRLKDEAVLRQKFYQDVTDDMKAEFIDGEVVLHSPAMNRHLVARDRLATLISLWVEIKGLGAARGEKCLCIFPRNDYEPDIVFFGKEKAAKLQPTTMKFPVPDFAVEVLSDSTEKRDRGVKFRDFEAHGVGEFWLIDPEHETLEQYVREPGKERFSLAMKSGTGEVESRIIQGFRIPVRAIFDAAENMAAMKMLLGRGEG